MSIELKVKAMSLAAEAVIIRRQQRKLERARHTAAARKMAAMFGNGAEAEVIQSEDLAKYLNGNDPQWMSLQHHRRVDVRQASRATHLARMFIKGVPYRAVEYACHDRPDWGAVEKMVRRYAPEKFQPTSPSGATSIAILEWRDAPPTNEITEKHEAERQKQAERRAQAKAERERAGEEIAAMLARGEMPF